MPAKAKSAARRLPTKARRRRASRPLLPPVTRVAIIGAGAGGSALLSILARDPLVRIVGIAEINSKAPGLRLAKLYGVPVDIVTVGSGGDYQSADGRWDSVSGTEPGGAVLVRPDGHVAWRAARATDDPVGRVSEVLGKILNRKVNVSANACCVSEV